MAINPDHKPEPTELYENPEGERGRESGAPEKPRTRPEDLPAKVDAGIHAVEDNLRIVPTAFGEASKHFGVDPANLVVEPDASELATSKLQLDTAGHQMHDLATALARPTLLQTEPQMSPIAGTEYAPVQLPVDSAPRVDGVSIPDRIVEEGYDIPTRTESPAFNSEEETFFEAGERANTTGVTDYSGYTEDMLLSLRQSIHEELDATDMLVGKKDATGKVVTQDRIDELHSQQEQITNTLESARVQNEPRPTITLPELSETQVRNYKMREGVEELFTKRVNESKADAGKEANFKVGDSINLPKHFSVDSQASWQVVKVENGQYLLEQTAKDGATQHLTTSEKELDAQGVKPKETTNIENQFKARAAKVRGETETPSTIKVGETVHLPIKYDKFNTDTSLMSKFAESPWKVAKADKGIFLLEKTDEFGNTQQLVMDKSELNKEGVKKSAPEVSKKPTPENTSKPAVVEAPTKKRKPEQHDYYRAVHEAAIQKALQDTRDNPEAYAKLAGSVVGATMRYNADGGASFIDRQGQVVKELGKDKVDEARLSILKDRIVPSLLREGVKTNAGFLTELDAKQKEIATIDSTQPGAEDRLSILRKEVTDLEENISQIQTWMQDLQAGKGDFSRNAEGKIQVVSPVEGMNLVVDQKALDLQENIISLQTEKLFSTRQAIEELAGNKVVVPESIKEDVGQGNFNFSVNDAMIVTVEIIGGKNDGIRFQLPPKITESILDGSLPKGDATPNLVDLQNQTKPDISDTKDKPDDNATEDEVEAKKPVEAKAEIQPNVEPNEKPEDNPLSKASDAMRQRILDLGSSEWQDQVKPLIEKMQFVGAERFAIRADNKGNLYAGLMSEDGKHMEKRLVDRIDADSPVGRLLDSDPNMAVLKSLENTVIEKEPEAKPKPAEQQAA